MRAVGVEVMGVGALKLTGFLREQMQQNNLNFESLYTVRTLKEVCYAISVFLLVFPPFITKFFLAVLITLYR